MKILIVGGSSAVARALRPKIALFSDVITAGRTGCDIELDLSWPSERMNIPSGIDCVINLAAHFGGKEYCGIYESEDINVMGSLRLSHACVRAEVSHMVQISSVFASLDEESPFYGSYSVSKSHSEDILKIYAKSSGLPVVILRLPQIYGEGYGFRRHQPHLYNIMDLAERGDDIILYGKRDAKRNLMHADDVSEIISRVIRKKITGLYTCATSVNVSYSEIAHAASSAFGGVSRVIFDIDKPDIPDNAFEYDETLFEMIDYCPTISLEKGMAREVSFRKAKQ